MRTEGDGNRKEKKDESQTARTGRAEMKEGRMTERARDEEKESEVGE